MYAPANTQTLKQSNTEAGFKISAIKIINGQSAVNQRSICGPFAANLFIFNLF
jgi:hypothetical protein